MKIIKLKTHERDFICYGENLMLMPMPMYELIGNKIYETGIFFPSCVKFMVGSIISINKPKEIKKSEIIEKYGKPKKIKQ